MDDDSGSPAPPIRRSSPAVRTPRTLQMVLGLFWILDAALQFQPYMFGHQFVATVILANTSGQPPFIGALIAHIGNFIAPDVAVWNTFFALIQLAIGIGLLFRRTARPALALSFAWVAGIWVIGEGLGMVFTGTASALTGAPGSALLYGLIGLVAWPRSARQDARRHTAPTGIASSAAGQGFGGARTPLATWTGYWVLAAVLFLLPDNRTTTSISSTIVGMAPGTPSWYARFLTSTGNAFHTTGAETAWVLAVVSLVIGVGPLVARRPQVFLGAGLVVSVLWWITGQGFLGGVFSGSGTDPNTGPLVVLLALAMVPTAMATRDEWRAPFTAMLRGSPALTSFAVVAVGATLALTATYPVAASESTSAAMSGMHMGGSTRSTAAGTGSTSTCTHQSGLKISGLDLNNTPTMYMSGNLGMDMNGSDASAAAGLNTTKVNWHYTGPALPAALAQRLLADGNNAADDIRMAVSGCATAVSATEQINATQYVQATSAAVAGLASPAQALAAGYVAASPTTYPVVYYVDPAIVRSNEAARRTLSPQHVDGLVFATTPAGTAVLAAAMYILPASRTTIPLPYGALVQWHQRTDVCGPTTTPTATAPLAITGTPPCASGSEQRATPYVTMVWQVPVAGGPLAIQPPDIQIVEAAIMQSTGS